MANDNYKNGYISILKTDTGGNSCGAGFFFSEKYLITCAHVINDALGRDSDEISQPTEVEVGFKFPVLLKN